MLLDGVIGAISAANGRSGRPPVSCCVPADSQGSSVDVLRQQGLRLDSGDDAARLNVRVHGQADCASSNCANSETSMELLFTPVDDEVTLTDAWSRAKLEKQMRLQRRQESVRSTVSPIMEGVEEEGSEEGDGYGSNESSDEANADICLSLDIEDVHEAVDAKSGPSIPSTTTTASTTDTSLANGDIRKGSSGSLKSGRSSLGSDGTPRSGQPAVAAAARAAMAASDERPQGTLQRALSRLVRASSSLSSLLDPRMNRMPTLASVSQRRTLESMVSLSLPSPELLRATRAAEPLRWFGSVLRDRRSTRVGFGRSQTKFDGNEAVVPVPNGSFDDFKMSFQTRHIDQFWSHSWRANTAFKVSVLLLYYNQGPAAVAACLAATLTMVLRGLNILPFMVSQEYPILGGVYSFAAWCSIAGFTTFVAVLMFWRPRQRVFLDKVCIHQTDPNLKKEGVESIGAFLYHSRTMLVLWDPSYVQRLWCVFEMAAFAWAHRNDLKNRVEIRPVIFAPVFFGLMMTSAINMALICFFPKDALLNLTVWPAIEAFWCVLGVHLLRSFHRDMTILKQHLAEFGFANARCYCCQVSHKVPETGDKISCDREVIQACIVAWFGSLNEFDEFVRAELASYFFRSLGSFGLPYRWIVGSQLPVLWAYMDLMAEAWARSEWLGFVQFIIEGIAVWLCASPVVVAFVIWVTNMLQTKRKSALMDALVSLLAAMLTLVPLAGMAFMWFLSRFVVSSNPVVGAVVFLVVMGELTTLTFKWGRSSCLRCRRG